MANGPDEQAKLVADALRQRSELANSDDEDEEDEEQEADDDVSASVDSPGDTPSSVGFDLGSSDATPDPLTNQTPALDVSEGSPELQAFEDPSEYTPAVDVQSFEGFSSDPQSVQPDPKTPTSDTTATNTAPTVQDPPATVIDPAADQAQVQATSVDATASTDAVDAVAVDADVQTPNADATTATDAQPDAPQPAEDDPAEKKRKDGMKKLNSGKLHWGFNILTDAVEAGSEQALVDLADAYRENKVEEEDKKEFIELFKAQAQKGNKQAKNWLEDHEQEVQELEERQKNAATASDTQPDATPSGSDSDAVTEQPPSTEPVVPQPKITTVEQQPPNGPITINLEEEGSIPEVTKLDTGGFEVKHDGKTYISNTEPNISLNSETKAAQEQADALAKTIDEEKDKQARKEAEKLIDTFVDQFAGGNWLIKKLAGLLAGDFLTKCIKDQLNADQALQELQGSFLGRKLLEAMGPNAENDFKTGYNFVKSQLPQNAATQPQNQEQLAAGFTGQPPQPGQQQGQPMPLQQQMGFGPAYTQGFMGGGVPFPYGQFGQMPQTIPMMQSQSPFMQQPMPMMMMQPQFIQPAPMMMQPQYMQPMPMAPQPMQPVVQQQQFVQPAPAQEQQQTVTPHQPMNPLHFGAPEEPVPPHPSNINPLHLQAQPEADLPEPKSQEPGKPENDKSEPEAQKPEKPKTIWQKLNSAFDKMTKKIPNMSETDGVCISGRKIVNGTGNPIGKALGGAVVYILDGVAQKAGEALKDFLPPIGGLVGEVVQAGLAAAANIAARACQLGGAIASFGLKVGGLVLGGIGRMMGGLADWIDGKIKSNKAKAKELGEEMVSPGNEQNLQQKAEVKKEYTAGSVLKGTLATLGNIILFAPALLVSIGSALFGTGSVSSPLAFDVSFSKEGPKQQGGAPTATEQQSPAALGRPQAANARPDRETRPEVPFDPQHQAQNAAAGSIRQSAQAPAPQYAPAVAQNLEAENEQRRAAGMSPSPRH